MSELLALHKKMYDVRWNGAEGDLEQLEKQLLSIADLNDMSLETVNKMLEQLYLPPYEKDRLPEHLKAHNHGGKREGAGRPSVGITRRVSLTLPAEIWEMIDQRKEELGSSQSATLRMMVEGYFNLEDNE